LGAFKAENRIADLGQVHILIKKIKETGGRGRLERAVGFCAVLSGGEPPNSMPTDLPPCVCVEMNESISEWSGLTEVTALIWCYRVTETYMSRFAQDYRFMYDCTSTDLQSVPHILY
jgi:hypothetical protein